MSDAYYIILDGEVPGVNRTIGLPFFVRERSDLEWFAKETGQPALSRFVISSTDASGWFTPEEGLKTVRFYRSEINGLQGIGGKDYSGLLDDLKKFEAILEIAAEHGALWHFVEDSQDDP